MNITKQFKKESKETIPIHLYLANNKLNFETLSKIIDKVKGNGVSYIWVEVNNKDDIDTINRISKYLDVKIVTLINNSSYIKKLINSRAPCIAIKPDDVTSLLTYKKDVLRKNIRIYLYKEIRDKGFYLKDSVNDFLRSFNILTNNNIKDLHTYINHPDPIVNFNLNKRIKAALKSSHIVPIYHTNSHNKNIIANSIITGSLLSEEICNEVLIKPCYIKNISEKSIYTMIELGKNILRSLNLYPTSFKIISCPTCGRCQMDLVKMAKRVHGIMVRIDNSYKKIGKSLETTGGVSVAIMGCNVNGPGEASHADIGIAGGKNKTATIFIFGKPVITLSEDKIIREFELHLKKIIDKKFNIVK